MAPLQVDPSDYLDFHHLEGRCLVLQAQRAAVPGTALG